MSAPSLLTPKFSHHTYAAPSLASSSSSSSSIDAVSCRPSASSFASSSSDLISAALHSSSQLPFAVRSSAVASSARSLASVLVSTSSAPSSSSSSPTNQSTATASSSVVLSASSSPFTQLTQSRNSTPDWSHEFAREDDELTQAFHAASLQSGVDSRLSVASALSDVALSDAQFSSESDATADASASRIGSEDKVCSAPSAVPANDFAVRAHERLQKLLGGAIVMPTLPASVQSSHYTALPFARLASHPSISTCQHPTADSSLSIASPSPVISRSTAVKAANVIVVPTMPLSSTTNSMDVVLAVPSIYDEHAEHQAELAYLHESHYGDLHELSEADFIQEGQWCTSSAESTDWAQDSVGSDSQTLSNFNALQRESTLDEAKQQMIAPAKDAYDFLPAYRRPAEFSSAAAQSPALRLQEENFQPQRSEDRLPQSQLHMTLDASLMERADCTWDTSVEVYAHVQAHLNSSTVTEHTIQL